MCTVFEVSASSIMSGATFEWLENHLVTMHDDDNGDATVLRQEMMCVVYSPKASSR